MSADQALKNRPRASGTQTLAGVSRVLGTAAATWLDAIFPPQCAGCGRRGSHFCTECRRTVQPVPGPQCPSCGRTVLVHGICHDCQHDPFPMEMVASAGLLEGPLRRAIHGLKYRGRRSAAHSLATLMVPLAARVISCATPVPLDALVPMSTAEAWAVVPVPLHPNRLRERGYNQAALLARPLASALGLPFRPDWLTRRRPTVPQVGLSRSDRRRNLHGAFAGRPAQRGWAILLVDDVATTGSTLGSAAEACRDAGAGCVVAVTLAREA